MVEQQDVLWCESQPGRPTFDAMKVIEWIVQLPVSENVPDIRTLSAMLYGNSKKLECKSFSGLIRKLMLPHIDDDVVDLLDDGVKLLEYFGISKYPIPMRFKANGLLHCRGLSIYLHSTTESVFPG